MNRYVAIWPDPSRPNGKNRTQVRPSPAEAYYAAAYGMNATANLLGGWSNMKRGYRELHDALAMAPADAAKLTVEVGGYTCTCEVVP